MVQGGRREEGSGWGTRVYLWRIHVDIWQNKYNNIKLKNKIKLKKKKLKVKKKNKSMFGTTTYPLERLQINKQIKTNLKIPSPSEGAEQLEISPVAIRNAK